MNSGRKRTWKFLLSLPPHFVFKILKGLIHISWMSDWRKNGFFRQLRTIFLKAIVKLHQCATILPRFLYEVFFLADHCLYFKCRHYFVLINISTSVLVNCYAKLNLSHFFNFSQSLYLLGTCWNIHRWTELAPILSISEAYVLKIHNIKLLFGK